jgi:hypothetical protein
MATTVISTATYAAPAAREAHRTSPANPATVTTRRTPNVVFAAAGSSSRPRSPWLNASAAAVPKEQDYGSGLEYQANRLTKSSAV